MNALVPYYLFHFPFSTHLEPSFSYFTSTQILIPFHIAGTLFHILTSICLYVHTFASFRILLHFTNIDKTSSSPIEARTENYLP